MSGYVGWKGPNDGRGTMSILHSCLATTIVCTWDALHMNVPADDDSELTKQGRHLKWMAFAILAPEGVATLALREWKETRWWLREILALSEAKHTCVEKGERQSSPSENQAQAESSESTTSSSHHPEASSNSIPWTRTHAFFVYMGGFNLLFANGERYRLNALQFLALVRNNHIALPPTPEKELKDKSKADGLTKGLACLQISWLVLYLISRATQGLPTTTLELFTVSVVCCTFFEYFAWWKKPKEVECAIDIRTNKSKEELMNVLRESENVKHYRYVGRRISIMDNIGRDTTKMGNFVFTYALPTLAFGTCHLLGWNTHSPSHAELLLWRISSVSCFVCPLASLLMGDISQRLTGRYKQIARVIIFVFVVLYGLFRFYLFVEIFIGLRSVPQAVYQDVHWTAFIPHIGS